MHLHSRMKRDAKRHLVEIIAREEPSLHAGFFSCVLLLLCYCRHRDRLTTAAHRFAWM